MVHVLNAIRQHAPVGPPIRRASANAVSSRSPRPRTETLDPTLLAPGVNSMESFRIETSIAATNIPAMGYITGPPFWTCSKKVSSVSSIFLAFNKVGSRGRCRHRLARALSGFGIGGIDKRKHGRFERVRPWVGMGCTRSTVIRRKTPAGPIKTN